MTQVILGKSRVREIRTPGSVRAKAEWLSYSTIPRFELVTIGGRTWNSMRRYVGRAAQCRFATL